MGNSLVKRILGTTLLGLSLLSLPCQKVKAEDNFRFYGAWSAEIKTFSNPLSVANIPDSLKDSTYSAEGLLPEINFDFRAGARYKPQDWFDVKGGLKADLSMTELEGYDGIVEFSPKGSITPGIFVRASFFDFLFAEYSADFFKQYSFIKDQNSSKLADFIDHEIIAGINIPIGISKYDDWTTQAINSFPGHKETVSLEDYRFFLRLSGGLDLPQIINRTSLGEEMRATSNPNFTFSFQLGGEY
jgi:hypothetical protein